MKVYGYLALVGMLAWGFFYAKHLGYDQRLQEESAARQKQEQIDQSLVSSTDSQESKAKVVYRERIRIIKAVVDDCINQPLPNAVTEQLLDASTSDTSRREADPGLPETTLPRDDIWRCDPISFDICRGLGRVYPPDEGAQIDSSPLNTRHFLNTEVEMISITWSA